MCHMRLSAHHLRKRQQHNTKMPAIQLTEWGCAVRTIHGLEKAFGEHVHLEKLAPLAHEILLARDVFDPFAMIYVCCRPEGHLVELASQVHKRDRETGFASTLELDWEYGRVRL